MKAPRKLTSLSVIVAVLCLLPLARAQTESSEESLLAVLIKSYYAAYAQRDLGALVRLWSERSPDLAASIEEAERTFAVEDHTFLNLAISLSRVTGNKAIVQVTADTTITNLQTRAKREERSIRNFALIKDGGQWKVWRDAPASEDVSAFLEKGSEWKVSRDSIEQFANVLVAARNEDERNKLHADNTKMMTPELREALIRRAGQEQAASRYEAALRILQLALAVAERAPDKEGAAIAHRAIGDTFRALGRVAQALEHYQKGVSGFEAIGRRSDRAATLLSIAQTHFAQKKYDLAIESYSKALAGYEALANTKATADTLEEMASVYYEQEKYDRALEHFERCLKLRERIAGKAEIASTLNSIGNVYFQQQEYDSAIQRYEKALAGFEELNNTDANTIKDPDAIVSTMSNIASAEYSRGSYEVALDHYLRALKLQDTLRDKHVAANLRLSIANIYSATGNYPVALEYLHQGLALFEAMRDKNKIATALSEAGEAYFQLRNYNLALSNYQRSVQIFEELRSAADTSMRLYAIGNVHFFMSNFDLAVESYEKALLQFEAIKHAPGVASMLASIAGTRYAQQQYDLALEFYQKSLAQYEALGDKSRAAGVIERIASVRYSKGEYAASLELVGRAIALAEQTANSDALWRARYTQGLALRGTDWIEQAKESFQLSIATIEAMRSKLVHGEPDAQHFFQNKNAAYSAMMELLVAQNKVADAFAYAERMRANSLSDIFQRTKITKLMTSAEAEQERRLERTAVATKAQMTHEREKKHPNLERYATLDLRLQKSIGDYRAFEAAIYAAHPRLKTLRGEAAPQGLENALALLSDSSTAFIEFVVTDTCTYLFALTRDLQKPAAARSRAPVYVLNAYVIKAGRAEIANCVKAFREMIAQRDEKTQQTARETYELLFNGAREQLSTKTTWLIAPDDALWQMPFAALRPAENRYLIEDHAIAYTPSLSALAEMTRPRASRTSVRSAMSLLAVGNPAISRQTAEQSKLMGGREIVNPPAESDNELKTLISLYSQKSSRSVVGEQASEVLVKREAGRYDIVHVAAPLVLNDATPLYSHATLAQSAEDGNEDGLLHTLEMLKLDLRAELIVFSGVETAAGRVTTGEALCGLGWACFVAGCPTEVISRWKADSPDTLMLEFHRMLGVVAPGSRGPISKAKALQRAMVKLIKDDQRKHPFHWAGAMLIGNPD